MTITGPVALRADLGGLQVEGRRIRIIDVPRD